MNIRELFMASVFMACGLAFLRGPTKAATSRKTASPITIRIALCNGRLWKRPCSRLPERSIKSRFPPKCAT